MGEKFSTPTMCHVEKLIVDNFIFLCSVSILYGTMDNLSFNITQLDEGRISVEVQFKVEELIIETLGILYFEKAKKSFNRKPVGMNQWICVDAKVEGLYTKDEGITPKQIVARCYDLIREAGY